MHVGVPSPSGDVIVGFGTSVSDAVLKIAMHVRDVSSSTKLMKFPNNSGSSCLHVSAGQVSVACGSTAGDDLVAASGFGYRTYTYGYDAKKKLPD